MTTFTRFTLAAMLIAGTGLGTTMVVAKTAAAPADSKTAIATALADPARADQAKDDARRKAAEVIAFAGVKPGDTVVDLIPGGGYWTRIFSPLVGANGHVYAVWPGAAAKYAEKEKPVLEARGLTNVTAQLDPAIVTLAKPADMVWTVQNYHDINNGGGETSIAAVDAAVFNALKPGGIYLVIDHADAAGSGMTGTSTKHRIEPAVVKAQVVKAGFEFVGESDVLRNADDDHSKNVFDPAIRGHTDQFVYKFRKPK